MRFSLNRQRPQLAAVFEWVRQITGEGDIIELEVKGRKKLLQFVLPAQPGAWPHMVTEGVPRFLIRLEPQEPVAEIQSWKSHFVSPFIEVWERLPHSASPLRFGLTTDEKREISAIARWAITQYLSNENTVVESSRTPGRLFSKADVAVALWVNGVIRGSTVVTGMPLSQGIARAAILASRDARFKPLEKEEAGFAHIEIAVLHPLRIPLLKEERIRDEIYPEKGYELRSRDVRAWLLPEVHNVRSYSSLEEFLRTLVQEKAGLPSATKHTNIYLCEVDNWIETGSGSIHALRGPVVAKQGATFAEDYRRIAHACARWLGGIQNNDGWLPAVISPWRKQGAKTDWIRCALASWALAEWGSASGDKSSLEASRKSFHYLRKYADDQWLSLSATPLFLCYFGQCARVLGEEALAHRISEQVRSSSLTETITASQAATLVRSLGEEPLIPVEEGLKKEFLSAQHRRDTQFAAYAELVNLFFKIDPVFANEVASWMMRYQRADGAFPKNPHSSFCYSRGVGKIIEVLSLDARTYHGVLVRALGWLSSMQFDETNAYFIPHRERGLFIGGFRHDGTNPEAWSDAAAHVLLASSRLFQQNI